MPLEQALKDLMLDHIGVELFTGTDRYNNKTFGPLMSDLQCQITYMNVQSVDRGGRELISTAQIIMADPELPITPDARVTMPDGTHPSIIQVLSAKDDVGKYYLEVRV
jgi:hypothetical protein